MSKLQELIAAKKKDIESKKGRQRPYKIPKGKHKVRILPSWRKNNEDPTFWHDFGQHFIKNEKGEIAAVYLCVENTFGQPCDVCAAIGQGIKSANSDDTIEALKEANSGAPKYLVNALILGSDNPNEPVVLELGTQVFESILGIIEEYGDITDLNNGIDVVIERTGSGRNDTKYTAMPAAKSAPVKKEVMDKVIDLDEYVSQENETGKTKALTAVANVAGVLPAGTTVTGIQAPRLENSVKSSPNLPSSDFDEDEPFEAEYIEEPAQQVVGGDAQAATAPIGDDDLDSLLDDL